MKRIAAVLIATALLVCAAPAPGQWLFPKKAKVNPSQRVPELILTVKTDPDERTRARAAEELREYDTRSFTEIVPVLIDVLLHDKKQSVRSEALTSLAKIRPVTTLAGQAMEKTASEDESLRLRWQAKTALPKYHLAGYSPRKVDPLVKKQTEEPPTRNDNAPRTLEVLPTFQPLPPASSFPRPLPQGSPTPPPVVEGPALFPK